MKLNKLKIVFGTFILIAISYFTYLYIANENFKRNGVYTIAKITCAEVHEQGSKLCFDVYYNGRIYRSNTGGIYKHSLGKYYFIKVLPKDPVQTQGPLKEVPKCILEKEIPKKGWKEIPKCND